MSTNLYVIDTFSFDTKNQPFSPKLKIFNHDKIEFIEFCSFLVFYKYSFYFFFPIFILFDSRFCIKSRLFYFYIFYWLNNCCYGYL